MMRIYGVLLLSVVIGCSSPESPKLIPKPVIQKGISEKSIVNRSGKVDILFVIDNSGSMGTYQTNLSNNISKFVNIFFSGAIIDYHIGVLSTDADVSTWAGATPNPTCCGKLQGTPVFIDKNTPNAGVDLSARMVLGTSGSATEQSFEPIRLALSEPLASTVNAGFLRPDAYLAVIFITDAQDQSTISPEDFHSFLVGIKGSKDKILSYAAIIPTSYGDQPNCYRDTGNPTRIETFMSMTANAGDNVYNLCDPDFGDKLAGVATSIQSRVVEAIYLDRAPIIESIEVMYGSQVIPKDPAKGWSYDASMNAIYLGKDVVLDTTQPEGTKIRVEANYTTYDEALQQKGK